MTYRLFLDDVREPSDVGNYIHPVELRKQYRLYDWIIVRNYPEFCDKINELGIPSIISFDHDLADVHYHSNVSDWEKETYDDPREFEDDYLKTGYHCAKWLIDKLTESNLPLPICYVHSMNPAGADNIKSILRSYLKYFNF